MKTVLGLFLLCWLASATAQTNAPRASTNKFKPYVPPAAPRAVAIKTNEIMITKVLNTVPPYTRCETSMGEAYLIGVPPHLAALQQRIASLSASTSAEAKSLRADRQRWKVDHAAAPQTASSATVGGAKIHNVNVRGAKLDVRDEKLEEATEELQTARRDWAQATDVTVVDTGQKYGSYPIWRVVR